MAKRTSNLKPLADEYGQIKAEITDLEERKGDIKDIFEQAGMTEVEGGMFRCVGSNASPVIGPDWEKIARKLGATDAMINHPANQKVTRKGGYRVSVYGRTGVGK